MRVAVVTLAVGLLTVGCAHTHRRLNAPGLVDVKTPPADLTKRVTERPGDPGEQMVVFSFGPFGGLGAQFGDGMLSSFGIELSLHRGQSDRSHNDDDFFIHSARSEGVNFGASLDLMGDDQIEAGAVYLEYQRAEAMRGWAAGLAFDSNELAVGPQVTLFFATLYLRGSYLIGDGMRLQAGIIIKLPDTWVWSR